MPKTAKTLVVSLIGGAAVLSAAGCAAAAADHQPSHATSVIAADTTRSGPRPEGLLATPARAVPHAAPPRPTTRASSGSGFGHSTSKPPASHPTTPIASVPTPDPSPSACVTAQLVGIPRTITMGSAPTQFNGVITNHCGTDLRAVAPVFQIVGGPANHVDATLQRFDPASGTWQAATMPEGDGANPLSFAASGTRLARGQSLIVRYQLTVTSRNPAEPTASILYAVAQPGDTQLAITTIHAQIATA